MKAREVLKILNVTRPTLSKFVNNICKNDKLMRK